MLVILLLSTIALAEMLPFDYTFAVPSSADLTKEEAEAIADAIMKLKVMPADELQRLGSNGRQYVLKNHTYSVLANKFINVMEDIRKTR